MARPGKQGIDYFPLDTVLDTSMELIEAEFGLTGFAVVVRLWQKIYAENGYYCEWTDEVALLFAKKNNVGGNAVSEIIAAAIKRGIFDKDMYEKYSVLTSAGIQKRYFEAVNRRVHIEVESRYLLVSCTQNAENVSINPINVDRNSINVDRNEQKKEKEIKEDKSILYNNKYQLIRDVYERHIGIMTTSIGEVLMEWLDSVDMSLIMYAIERAVEDDMKTPGYIYGILSEHSSSGRTTAEQARLAAI